MSGVCFTGHRKIEGKDRDRLTYEIQAVIEKLAAQGERDFYCGGALGFDTMCAEAVLKAKEKAGEIKLRLVLPCSNEAQTARWSDSDKHTFYSIMMFADDIEYVGEEYTSECMKKRNSRLVELSSCCVCYYNPKDYRSGTGQTVRMAQRKGVPIINLY